VSRASAISLARPQEGLSYVLKKVTVGDYPPEGLDLDEDEEV
jgi:hypothetical protein